MTESSRRRSLGATGISLPQLGIGTDSWGERIVGFGRRYGEEDLYEVFKSCLDAGFDFFDTAPSYGRGEAESMIGRFRKRDGRPVIVATKFDNATLFTPSSARNSAKAMKQAIDASLQRLCTDHVDLYQIHFPVPERDVDEYAEVLSQLLRDGKARSVGVSNFKASLLRKMHRRLAELGVPLASNQVSYNLVERSCETNGVLAACHELDVTLIAFTPLALGLLTGKFRSDENRLRSYHKIFFRAGQLDLFGQLGPDRPRFLRRLLSTPRALRDLEPLFLAMDQVAIRCNVSPAQVALNWLRSSDPAVLPIPGAKSAQQLLENAKSVGWTMSKSEWDAISRAEIESR